MTKHILVINDTQEILQLFGDILTGEGYEVTLQAFGKDEVDDIRAINPDLIIMDFPPLEREQYGWQLLQKLKTGAGTDSLHCLHDQSEGD